MHQIAGFEPFRSRHHSMTDRRSLRLDIRDRGSLAIPAEPPGVERLPTTFGIERRLLDEHIGHFSLTRDWKHVGDGAIGLQPVIADEARCAARDRRREVRGCAATALPLAL